MMRVEEPGRGIVLVGWCDAVGGVLVVVVVVGGEDAAMIYTGRV